EGESCSLFRTEEDVDIGKDLLDAFSCLIPGPKIAAEVYVKGNQGPGFLEPPDHLYPGFPALLSQTECNTACVEAAGGRKEGIVEIVNGNIVDRGMLSVVYNTRFPRIGAVLIIVDPKPRVLGIVIDEA